MSNLSRRFVLRSSAMAVFGTCLPAAWGQFPRWPRQGERPIPGRNYIAELVESFKLSQTYTMECAQTMPEKHFGFRPVPQERSFGQQMVHIAEALVAVYEMSVEEKPVASHPYSEAGAEPVKSKIDLLNQLEAAFGQVERGVARLSDNGLEKQVELLGQPATKLRVLQFLLNHTAHHRGEIVVYMRLKGVTPPSFRA